MKPPVSLLCLLSSIVLLAVPAAAIAQYMFLDVDGDGVYTWQDTWPSHYGVVDVYLVTDKNWDGSPVGCEDGSGIGVYSYAVNLFAAGDSVTFSNVENMMPGMTLATPLRTYPFALTVGYEGQQRFGPGTWHLLRIGLEFKGGHSCPALSIVRESCYSAGVVTSFGSDCPGTYGDFVLRMGLDFNELQGFMCTDLTGHAPALSCPGEVHGKEGETLTFRVTAIDPECGEYPFSFWNFNYPEGVITSALSAFQVGQATQDVTWTPRLGQAGEYGFRFAVTKPDAFNMTDRYSECLTRVIVDAVNAAPTADAGGPYTGVQDAPLSLDGSSSSDLHGDPLTYAWSFGDGATAVGAKPRHTYAFGGLYRIILVVTDPAGLSGADTTTASIVPALPVEVFTTAGDRVSRLTQGKPFTCFQVEPGPGAAYQASDIVPSSIRFHVDDCGGVDVLPDMDKKIEIHDSDHDGVAEVQICVSSDAWGSLARLAPGEHEVTVVLRGYLVDGQPIVGSLAHVVIVNAHALGVRISPNPIALNSSVEFATTRHGSVTARLFDIRGRYLGTVLDRSSLEAGAHTLPLEGLAKVCEGLASGIYFVRIETEYDGAVTRSVAMVH